MLQQQLAALVVGTSLIASGAAFAQQATPAAGSSTTPAGTAPAGAARAGFVKSIQGTVRLVGPSGEKRPLKVGDAVAAANRIESDADSGASVVLRDGTVLVLGPSSQLDLKQFSFDSTTQEGGMFVSLARGSMRMISGLLGKKPETVRVDTQTATIGIRGTDFIVASSERL
ncbi:MAG: FecR domain-containing protein [Proteobacteria bacterium]|nr:FecR domain-containing protein [Pseudomonadota bacterium]